MHMNRLSEVDSITFSVNGETRVYSCVSGRLKYRNDLFSIKCRIDGADGIDGICSQATEIAIRSADGRAVYEGLSGLEIKLDSATVSPASANIKYVITGKGSLKDA